MKLKRKPINYKVMSKERELLEAFVEYMHSEDVNGEIAHIDFRTIIEPFLATLPGEKEEPDYKNCTNDIVSGSGFCKLGLPCKDCRFYHNPNNQ